MYRYLRAVCLVATTLLVPVRASTAEEPTILAVLDVQDGSGKFVKKDLRAATDYLRGLLAQLAGFEVVDKGRQERKRRLVIDGLRRDSGNACYDEKCRVQLGGLIEFGRFRFTVLA